MWTLDVVLVAERIEVALLGRTGAPHRFDRLALECPVHPFMRPVLLRFSWANPLMLNAEAHPPDVQVGQAMNGVCREGNAIALPVHGGGGHSPGDISFGARRREAVFVGLAEPAREACIAALLAALATERTPDTSRFFPESEAIFFIDYAELAEKLRTLLTLSEA